MFGFDPEKMAKNYLEEADLNHDGIADKKQLMPAVEKLGKAVEDLKSAVDVPRLSAGFSKIASALEVLEVKSAVKLVDGLQFSDLTEMLKDETAQKAAVQAVLGLKNVIDSINRPILGVAVKDSQEAWAVIEAYKASSKKK